MKYYPTLLLCLLFLVVQIKSFAQESTSKKEGFYYIMASSGLNLREGASSSTKKITTIPFGAKVELKNPVSSKSMNIDNIPGGMAEVTFEGKNGYVFDGYLSRFPMPRDNEKLSKYVDRARDIIDNILLETINRDWGGYLQYEEAMTLPGEEWAEAFYIAKSLFKIPEKLNFPPLKSSKQEVKIKNPEKNEFAWIDEMTINYDEDSRLISIQYYLRGDGGGLSITIEKQSEENGIRISKIEIAD